MKKALSLIGFSFGYAITVSLGIECLVNLLSLSFGISIDGGHVLRQYPRFFPFCIVAGLVSAIATVALAVLNVKASEGLNFTKRTWFAQLISAFIISLPLIKAWEILFDLLHTAL